MVRKYRKWIRGVSLLLFSTILGCGAREMTAEELVETWKYESTDGREAEVTKETEPTFIGVAMPTRTSERWINDGANMKAKLEILGYTVDLEYAEDDIQMQVDQIHNMLENQVDCLVISSIDSKALIQVLEEAKEKKVPVIAYDRLLMDTDAISYYASFDNKEIGIQIGEYIEETKQLKEAQMRGESYTIEFFMGSPDDNNAWYLYDGLMEVLESYLEDGTLICKSGKTSFEDTCILCWSEETARQRCVSCLKEYYQKESLDIVCSAFDGFSYGVKNALMEYGYKVGDNWPLVTGQDAEQAAVRNILNGYQSMTIYKDTRILADRCVNLVQAVMENTPPEINDRSKYDNGKLVVPTYLCQSVVITEDNYEEELIQSGYYTKLQLNR